MKQHFKRQHNDKYMKTCEFCGEGRKECNKGFGRFDYLQGYMYSSHGLEKLCDKCDYKTQCHDAFNSHLQALKHDQVAKEIKKVKQECDKGDEVYVSAHKGIFYLCEICEYETQYKQHLTYHKDVTHDQGNTNRMECDESGRVYVSSNGLKQYKEVKHKSILYTCQTSELKTQYKQAIWFRCYHKYMQILIWRLPFRRLKKLVRGFKTLLRFQSSTVMFLQTASETFKMMEGVKNFMEMIKKGASLEWLRRILGRGRP